MDVKTTLETAQDTVLNKRDQQYGVNSRVTMHERIARVWSAILSTEVTGLQVARRRARRPTGHDRSLHHRDRQVRWLTCLPTRTTRAAPATRG